jgi:hypothetical protein
MTHTLRTILLAALLLGTAGRLSAQAIGSIRGTVVDTSQAIINGAAVVATNSATGSAAAKYRTRMASSFFQTYLSAPISCR